MAPKPKLPWEENRQATLARLLRGTPGLSDSDVAGQEGEKQISSGIVGDLFDILGRPSRAVAGAAYSAVDDDPSTSVLGGLGEGLTGKTKHNFAEVLDAMGLKNQVAKSTIGFGLDVALDPLTYVGVKGNKGLNATEAMSQAVRGLETKNIAPELFGDAATRLAAQLQAENPSHLYVQFAGKNVTPKLVTPSKIANTIKDTIIGPETERKSVARMFSRESELPFGLAQKARVYESGSAAAFQDHQLAIKNIFSELHPDDARNIAFALDEGQDLGSVPLTNGVKRDGMNTQGDYQRLARKLFDQYFDDEVAVGLRSPGQKVDNYVYKFSQKGMPEQYPGLSKVAVARLNQVGARFDVNDLSLRNMEAGGLEPLTNIGDILTQRSAGHYRQVGRAELIRDAVTTFGAQATDANTATLKKLGWLDAGGEGVLAAPAARAFEGQGLMVPPEIVKVLNQTERIMSDNVVGGDFVKWYDKITHKWKFLNTVVNPGYWTRNSMSDGIMNFMDGVRNPKHYDQSFRTLMEHRSNNTAEMLAMIGDQTVPPGSVKGTKVTFGAGTKNEIRIDAKEAWDGFLRGGGKSGDITTNITAALDPAAKEGLGNYINKTTQRAASTPGKAGAKLADWNNMREDFFRLAHHYSAVDELVRRGVPYEDAILKAGQRVRKYNIDYGALSSFEKQYVRRAIPFYSWMRRNTPLQVELLLTRPGFMAGYSKGNDLMQGLLGTEDGSGDYMIPKWIRDSAPVRVAMSNNKSSNPIDMLIRKLSGAKDDESVFVPTVGSMTPLGDIQHLTQPIQAWQEAGGFSSPGKSTVAGLGQVSKDVVNMGTPAVKALVEGATQKSLYTGAPIENWQDWLVGQIAPGRLGQAAGSGVDNAGLTSQLLGLQLKTVDDARQKGEFRRREDVLQGRIAQAPTGTRAQQWKRYLKQSRRSVGA